MVRLQFSVRTVLAITAAIAFILFMIITPRFRAELASSAYWGMPGAAVGAVIGRAIGRDSNDARLGAIYGVLIGLLVWLALPAVE